MKNLKNQIKSNLNGVFIKRIKSVQVLALSFVLLFSVLNVTDSMAQQVEVGIGVHAAPPYWAPVYDHVDLVQYYYLPDIECYYDVWNGEFIYMEDGNWMFASALPPMYAWYDFNNCFAVVLDWHVHQPWMHYHYYVAHYPRYYYRSVYRSTYNDPGRPLRGFNENGRAVVYRGTDDRHINEPRHEPVSREPRVQQTRPPQRMEYYGKTVGRPVKVEKQMMRPSGGRGGRK